MLHHWLHALEEEEGEEDDDDDDDDALMESEDQGALHTHNNKMIMLEPESSEVFESLDGL